MYLQQSHRRGLHAKTKRQTWLFCAWLAVCKFSTKVLNWRHCSGELWQIRISSVGVRPCHPIHLKLRLVAKILKINIMKAAINLFRILIWSSTLVSKFFPCMQGITRCGPSRRSVNFMLFFFFIYLFLRNFVFYTVAPMQVFFGSIQIRTLLCRGVSRNVPSFFFFFFSCQYLLV